MHIIGQLIVGLIIGVIARLLLDLFGERAPISAGPIGWLITAGIGIAGSFIGSMVGRLIERDQNYKAGWILSILGAVGLLLLIRFVFHMV